MSVAPDPIEIFDRAVEEGERRLDQSMLELVATSFIAGFTVVFGIVALGIAEAFVEPRFGHGVAKLVGALAFAPALVFLVVGRTELFNENFFDPVAKAVDADDSWLVGPLVRLWTVTFALNLVGGTLFVAVLSVKGALPNGTADALVGYANDFVHRRPAAEFAKGIVGGTLVTLLSFLLEAVNSVGSRIAVSYIVGVLLTLGVFDHVIVTILHVVFGMFLGANIGLGELAVTTAVVTAGNLVGGLGLVTLTHVAQWKGARESSG
ncbi:formate/nitrite transporter family protein [Halorussus gelatinilyticus]|uniref:Formate/nitrite transporter family protein n=1 Tax=Halorussus gelatinilyticus TaxID=2937524 RepID=A0A8U0IDN9_9EURY|nr:formate/nitrite transporter family protein [Halorussus gelatinilyticus]UPV98820.1 formate/nitrite transporter family protein [Halorussus gelatinilyticus]